MKYHRVTRNDCVSVADYADAHKLDFITDMSLLRKLANRWCDINGYKLGGYLGGKDNAWDATRGD